MRVVVTGAAGMIGSNLMRGLNGLGIDDIIAVDDLRDGGKFRNMLGAKLSDYFDKSEFITHFASGRLGSIDVVFHQGACSDTMEHDGRFMLENNYRYSKDLLDVCQSRKSQLIYASSAAIYGGGKSFRESPECECPLNVYGYSKQLFDDAVRLIVKGSKSQIVGLRYFNVYGPRERHKGRMASVAMHNFDEFHEKGAVTLFGEYGGYTAGNQLRDFVFVEDVVAVNLWFLTHPDKSGIFNVGTGLAQPFNDVAHATVSACRAIRGEASLSLEQYVAQGLIRYVEFPAGLVGKYQCYTQADLGALRAVGCDCSFVDVANGVRRYVEWLDQQAQ
jgi:ADP-L-glycero-D-manno-heptose 6-epimerase